MRRDSIFYKLFQQSPNLLFELLTNPPANADEYRFDSVAVKEPKFEIDGVFLPPENRAIINLLTTIMVYKFESKSQREVEEMLGITLQETRVYREIKEEGRQEGLQREKSLVLRLLNRRVGELPQEVRQRVESLSLEQLENLGEALLDFTDMTDLQAWLEALES
jgi:predicted transposase YdaD